MRTAMERRPYRDKAAVHADGAMRGRAAVPSAAARRQDGGSPYGRVALRRDRRQDGGSHIGEPIMGSRRPGGSLLKLREMARIE